jgi:broad-specificity NMP kinase
MGPSSFRMDHLEPYAEATRSWLHDEAEVVDTTNRTPREVAKQIADAVELPDFGAI